MIDMCLLLCPDSPSARYWSWDCGGDRCFRRKLTAPDNLGRYWDVFGVVYPDGHTSIILRYGSEEREEREGISETQRRAYIPDLAFAGAWVEVWADRWLEEILKGGSYAEILARVLQLPTEPLAPVGR